MRSSAEQKEKFALMATCAAARTFLAMSRSEKNTSNWLGSIRNDRSARTFFVESAALGVRGIWFDIAVAERVAKAYIDCAECDYDVIGPTRAQFDSAKNSAMAFQRTINEPWISKLATTSSFRQIVAVVAENPTAVPLRRAGRPPMIRRQKFVLSLAEEIYFLSGRFPTGLMAASAALSWDDTTDRQIRLILTDEAIRAISVSVATRKENQRISEDGTSLLIENLRRSACERTRKPIDNRGPGERVAQCVEILRGISDAYQSTGIIDGLLELAENFGVEMPEPPSAE